MRKSIPDPYKMKRIAGPKLTREQVKSAKVRVTTYIDGDVLDVLKETALGSGGRYQTMLNQILRQSLLGGDETVLDRIVKLERAVFKKTKAA